MSVDMKTDDGEDDSYMGVIFGWNIHPQMMIFWASTILLILNTGVLGITYLFAGFIYGLGIVVNCMLLCMCILCHMGGCE